MGKLRSINTSIWADTWFEELPPLRKLLFIYFITNERTNMLGIYEISIRKISFETGIMVDEIESSLNDFQKSGRILYKSNRVILVNYLRHQRFNTNMQKSAIDCYNELPKSLKMDGQVELQRDKKGFESLLNHFGMVRKIEVEVEVEVEDEREVEADNFPLDDLKNDKDEYPEPIVKNNQPYIPSEEVFLQSVKEIASKFRFNPDMRIAAIKYENWVDDGWKNGKPLTTITNYKSAIRNSLPHWEKKKTFQDQKQESPTTVSAPKRGPNRLVFDEGVFGGTKKNSE